jgi:pimeloyl-ACP methyl ester carboxylesterase
MIGKNSTTVTKRRNIRRATIAAAALTLAAVSVAVQSAGASTATTTTTTVAAPIKSAPSRLTSPKPTVVLVHGAFADASSWFPVIDRLRRDGYPVLAPANPLEGPAEDAASIRSVLDSITGPIILVGHSYGGAVITNAAANNPKVKALVYVAALVPDKGETVGGLSAHPVEHPIAPLPLVAVPSTDADGNRAIALHIDNLKFAKVFAADINPRLAADLAVSQRSVNAAGFAEASVNAAWRDIPSWYLVANQDKALDPAIELFMARRAKAHTYRVDSSHAVMLSHPDVVTRLVETADRGTR